MLAAAAVTSLAACQIGGTHSMYDTARECVIVQSAIGETNDQDAAGRVLSYSATASRDGYCDRGVPLRDSRWSYIAATTISMKIRPAGGEFRCTSASDILSRSPGTQSDAAAVSARWCGEGRYYALGEHEAVTPGGAEHYVDSSRSPSGYNS